jgi:hypothetical protein
MLRVVILGLSLELLLSSLDRVRRIWGAITSEPPQSMAGGLNHFERKWNPSSLLDMKNFAPVLLVLSVLSTMAVPQNARFHIRPPPCGTALAGSQCRGAVGDGNQGQIKGGDLGLFLELLPSSLALIRDFGGLSVGVAQMRCFDRNNKLTATPIPPLLA